MRAEGLGVFLQVLRDIISDLLGRHLGDRLEPRKTVGDLDRPGFPLDTDPDRILHALFIMLFLGEVRLVVLRLTRSTRQ